MIDTKSVLDQIHELQVLVTKLRELKVEISESFQVGAIIAKLHPKVGMVIKRNSFIQKMT